MRGGLDQRRRATWFTLLAIAVFASVACSRHGTQEGDATASSTSSRPLDLESLPEPPPNRPEDIPRPFEPDDPRVADLSFTEVSVWAGLTEPTSSLALLAEDDMSSGAAVADINGDGHLDIFLPRIGKPNGLYLNDGTGRFTDVARQAGVAGPAQRFGSSAGAFLDVDGDGDLDLFVAGAGRGANQLFINDGTGRFTEESQRRGFVFPPLDDSDLGSHTHGVTVADFNRDGHLDLLVLHWYAPLYGESAAQVLAEVNQGDGSSAHRLQPCAARTVLRDAGYPVEPNAEPLRAGLFINDGTGHFSERSTEFQLPLAEIVAFTGVATDLNHDGYTDLAITGDGCTSRLFLNNEGTGFTDVTERAGVGTDENGMGAVIRDLDGNGHPDLFITAISYPTSDGTCPVAGMAVGCSGNRVYLNDGRGTFEDATDEFGLRDGGWGWGAAIEDFDNDGRLEVVATNGFEEQVVHTPPTSPSADREYFSTFVEDATRFWVLDETSPPTYRDAAAAVGIGDTSIGHALVPFDMDGDGDLDLLIVPSNGHPLLYRNDVAGRSWISVRLEDTLNPGNSWGDGARIDVTTDPGSAPHSHWITTSGSYESQRPPTFHLGLGERRDPLHRVDIWWPGAAAPQTLSSVPLDQQLTVTRAG